MRATWDRLRDAKMIEFYSGNRLRLTWAGKALDLSQVKESSGLSAFCDPYDIA